MNLKLRRLFLTAREKGVPFLDDKAVGKEMKKLRTDRGVQLKFVASVIGVTSAFISDLEGGKRHWTEEKVSAYKQALGIPDDKPVTAKP